MIKEQYIDVIDQEYPEEEGPSCVTITLVVNGHRMPYKRYDFTGDTSFAKARQKALALAYKLGKQLNWEVTA